MDENFKPDSSIKKFLKEISTKELIKLVNAIFETKYSLDAEVVFENTENFTIKGDLDKNSVVGDLTIVLNSDETNNAENETTDKIVIELQVKKDESMGFRMFVYSLNASKLKTYLDENLESIDVYTFPKGVTIYTNLTKAKQGVDEVYLQIENFSVGNNHYSAKKGDLLKIDFPFINVLTMDFEEFKNSDLEILKLIYPYIYMHKPSLFENTEALHTIVEEVSEYINTLDENDKIVAGQMVTDIFVDVHKKAKSYDKKFEKAVEIMEVAEKSFSQIMIEKGIEKGILKGEKDNSIKTAQKMLSKNLSIEMIAECTDLTIDEIINLQNEK